MKLQHPYCRTCGSTITSRNVCHHCGCEPMKGNNYCCDCGTSTNAQAIMCVECGASFQRKFPAALAILFGSALVVTLACAGYFITQSDSEPSEKITDNNPEHVIDPDKPNKNSETANKETITTIINNIPSKLLKKKNDAILRLTKNVLPQNIVLEKSPPPKPVVPEKIKEEKMPVATPQKTEAPAGRISMNVFSSRELRSYSVGCTYYEGRSKNNIVFFTTNVFGYVKVNGKVYALQGTQKTNDIAKFSGAGYEVTIEIEGLAGNESNWVAAGTMVITDIRQRNLSRHKIYSSCTDF